MRSQGLLLDSIIPEIENITKSLEEMSLMFGRKNDWSVKQLEILKNNLSESLHI